MFLFCWYFDFLCKFKIFNEPWYIDKRSFLLYFAYFFSSKLKDWSLKLAYASRFMQNMAVDSFIENKKIKIVIKFQFKNFMTYLARVANSMIIFSASYLLIFCFYLLLTPGEDVKDAAWWWRMENSLSKSNRQNNWLSRITNCSPFWSWWPQTMQLKHWEWEIR